MKILWQWLPGKHACMSLTRDVPMRLSVNKGSGLLFSAHSSLEATTALSCQTLKPTELWGFSELVDERIPNFMDWVGAGLGLAGACLLENACLHFISGSENGSLVDNPQCKWSLHCFSALMSIAFFFPQCLGGNSIFYISRVSYFLFQQDGDLPEGATSSPLWDYPIKLSFRVRLCSSPELLNLWWCLPPSYTLV